MWKVTLVVPFIFFVASAITLPDYGINWDEPQHFNRGHAYLHYFLTGERNYLNLPQYPKLAGSSDFRDIRGEDNILYKNVKTSSTPPDPNFRRSYFQSDVFNFEYFVNHDSGHPPINGILSAAFNLIFYQKLGILGDIEAHHLFNITVSTLLVLVVAIFSYQYFGLLVSIVSSITLSTYPLFFSESHFNIKDPPEAAFFGMAIMLFYMGITQKRTVLIYLSSILTGLALGTKFNALFLVFILIPWIFFYLLIRKIKIKHLILQMFQRKNTRFSLSLLLYPLIITAIFYLFWPFLWAKPLENIGSIINYYLKVGTEINSETYQFNFFGFNTFPLLWIIYSTPVPVLILLIVGIFKSLREVVFKRDHIFLLLLLWFMIPILRVSLPFTNIYGGVRQIMEFIPALALLSGIGVLTLYKILSPKLSISLIVLLLSFSIYEVILYHPNQNVYFNQLIGGLKGAKVQNFPSWGNSFGNVYLQGVNWLNQNAEVNAKLGLPIGVMVNIPRVKLREDIDFSNEHFSGPIQLGEYQMELSHDYSPKKMYSYSYLDTFLNPVYTVKVEGVELLKIWKNDPKFNKFNQKEINFKPTSAEILKDKLIIDLGQEVFLTSIYIENSEVGCSKALSGYVATSSKLGEWIQEADPIEYPQMSPRKLGIEGSSFFYLFPARKARYILLHSDTKNSCILKSPQIGIKGLEI